MRLLAFQYVDNLHLFFQGIHEFCSLSQQAVIFFFESSLFRSDGRVTSLPRLCVL
eukprot:TRINITY_DN11875_c0_g1_i1.p2 TRINITY_DN11875_c0_g1~~TRINITY_DN11875_c0_g1_i1.p2  ORF type:complete len:55 (-),score=1.59 TRINITY_DN11875_c0_g1_i1:397-561(-)